MNAWLRAFFASFEQGHSPSERGMRLLKSQLTATQVRQYEYYGWFEVTGGETGHRFRIHRGDALNVDEYDSTGKCILRWCFMPTGNLVRGDVLLAQKLALELFESQARKIANKFPTTRPERTVAWGLRLTRNAAR